jgi:hypothetical protein
MNFVHVYGDRFDHNKHSSASDLYQKRFDAVSSGDALAMQAGRVGNGNWIDN